MWQAPYDDYPGLILDPGRPDSILTGSVCGFRCIHLEEVDVDRINENPPLPPSILAAFACWLQVGRISRLYLLG